MTLTYNDLMKPHKPDAKAAPPLANAYSAHNMDVFADAWSPSIFNH